MHLGSPLFLVLFAGLALAAAWVIVAYRWRSQAKGRFAEPSRFGRLAPAHSRKRQLVKTALLLGGMAFVAIAAARPWWRSEDTKVTREGVDLVVVLDVSLSMQAQDVQPSRFARAQDELSLLLDRLAGDRVGLVFFANAATVRAPLTVDGQAIKQLIARAPEDAAFLSPGSSIADGIASAQSLLKDQETAGRAILVVTDGEDFREGAAKAAAEANAEGIIVYTAGVGTAAGGTIPIRGTGGQVSLKQDPRTEQPAVTKANEPLLRSVAQAGGGRYLNGNAASPALTSLIDDLNKLQLTTFDETGRQRPVEQFQWFAAAALLLLVAELIISERRSIAKTATSPSRFRRLRLAPLALLALTVGCTAATTVYRLNEEGNQAFLAGNFDTALKRYQEAQQERPDLPELNYNTGNTLHKQGSYDRAIAESRRAIESDQTTVRDQAYYSIGNHYFRQGKWREAYDAYRSALIQNPNDEDARHNLEVVLRRLDQQPQPPQQEQQQPGNGNQGAQPQPTPGQQQPGEPSDQQPGATQPGSGQSPSLPSPNDQETRRAIEDALAGIDDNFSIEDAIRILDLLRQQQAEQAQQQRNQQQRRSTQPDW